MVMDARYIAKLMHSLYGVPIRTSVENLRKADPSFTLRNQRQGNSDPSFTLRTGQRGGSEASFTMRGGHQKEGDASANVRTNQKINMDPSQAHRDGSHALNAQSSPRQRRESGGQQGHVQAMQSNIDMDTNPAHTMTDQELEGAVRISGRIEDPGHANFGWHQRNKGSAEGVLNWRKQNGITVVRGSGPRNKVSGANAAYYQETYHDHPVDYTGGLLGSPSAQVQRVPRPYDVSEGVTADSYSRKPIAN